MTTNLILPGATKLNKREMKSVRGGVSEKEYCDNLHAILSNKENVENMSKGARAGAGYGWNKANCQRWYRDILLPEEP